MVKIAVVDENDIVIGYKERNETDKDIIRASVVWILSPEGKVLLARRSLKKKWDAGKWSMSAGGTIEEGETYESNIPKEIEEELGIRNVTCTPGQKIFLRSELLWTQVFFATLPLDSAFHLQEEEVAEVRWFERDELETLHREEPEAFSAGFEHPFAELLRELDRRSL